MATTPCGWTPTPVTSAGACCPDPADPANAAAIELANTVATNIIWRLTGMRFGCCSITVRPCKPFTCDPITLSKLIYWDSRAYLTFGAPNLGVLSFFPTLIDGQVFNIQCGCPQGCCKCRADCEFKLPGPVCTVDSVTVDGVVLDPSKYRVYDGYILAFDSDSCPGCQDYNLDAGEVGTWSVTYSVGTPVPADIELAAGLYANEVLKSLLGDKSCALPERVQQVARQGTTVAFLDPTDLLNEGLTGLRLVDQIIRSVNPYQLHQPPRVWSPSKRYRTRQDTP